MSSKGPRLQRLMEIANDYATAFPDWSFYRNAHFFGLWRSSGPIRQNIWFGVKSDGEYRLSHDVTSFIPTLILIGDQMPWVGMLTQFLSIRDRLQSISSDKHPARWRDAVAAMEREFTPSVRNPLDLVEVAELCATEVRTWNHNNLTMMAILHVWLGKRDEARQHCIRLQTLEMPANAEMHDWVREMKAFGLDLLRAIEAGTEQNALRELVRLAETVTGDA